MSLPAELRLAILELVLEGERTIVLHIGTPNINRNELCTTLRPHMAPHASEFRTFLPRLSFCRQARIDAQKVFFDNTLLILAVSLYHHVSTNPYDDSMKPLPNEMVPSTVLDHTKHLALVTELRRSSWKRHGFRAADLRYLQAMTQLKTLRLVFRNPFAFGSASDESRERCSVPLRSVVESIPIATQILLDFPESSRVTQTDDKDLLQDKDESDTGQLEEPLAASETMPIAEVYAKVDAQMRELQSRRGVLSGSTMNHSSCYQRCEENKDCVNSTLSTPPPKKPGALKMTVSKTVAKMLSTQSQQGNLYRGDVRFR